jgi:hypothetical protein
MRTLVVLAAAFAGWVGGRGSAVVVPVGALGSSQPRPDASVTTPPAEARVVTGSPSESAGVATPPSEDGPPGAPFTDELRTRAARGELEALKRIELRVSAERTIDDARALVLGHAELTRRDGVRLVEDLARDASLWNDRATLARLVELARDPSVAPDVLAALARTGHPTAADLLDELRHDFPQGARLGLYARDLLHSTEVRKTWSPALRIAIELSEVQGCPKALTLVERAREQADSRAVGALGRLGEREGCGPKRRDDCYPCLHDPEQERALVEAREAARSRPFERAWILPKRY